MKISTYLNKKKIKIINAIVLQPTFFCFYADCLFFYDATHDFDQGSVD